MSPPSAAGGDIGFGVYFGHRHHHHHYQPDKHYRPDKRYRPYKHYRRHPYPRYYRHGYYYQPRPYYRPADPWAVRPYRRFRECFLRNGPRYCAWVYD
jgi:hypothetical protein